MGHVATLTEDRAGVQTVTLPDGRVVTTTPIADERFGLRGTSQGEFTITLPSGLANTTTVTQTPTLATEGDPLSLSSLATTTNVNGRVFDSVYDVATRTRTETTPEGRVTTTVLDAQGRVIETQLPGRLPTTTTCDADGRVIETTQGTRTWQFSRAPTGPPGSSFVAHCVRLTEDGGGFVRSGGALKSNRQRAER